MERWSLLALLRFWLATIVAVNHVAGFADPGPLSVVPQFGALEAILGFLLISGYSVASSYIKQPAGYFMRRARRIYPVYLVAVAFTYAIDPAPLTPATVGMLAANILFLNQAIVSPSYVAAAWSLSLEVWLYLLAPWLQRRTVKFLLLLIALSFAAYVVQTMGRSLFRWPYYAWQSYGLNLLTLAFAWIAGWVAASWSERHRALAWIAALLATHLLLALAIQCAYRLKHHLLEALPHDLVGIGLRGMTLFLVWAVFRHILTADASRALRRSSLMHWLGDLSYPLYLLHIPVYILLQRAGVTDVFLLLTGALLLSLVVHQALEIWTRTRLRRVPQITPAAGTAR